MQHRILSTVAIILAMSLYAFPSLASDSKAATAGETKSPEKAKPAKKSAKAPPKVKIVDINSASKAELMKLPGIGEAEADKIIADRPFLSKAHLVTHKILPAMVYESLKGQIMAKPNAATEAKLKEMEKAR
jgi:competence protein ComEA